MHAFFKFLNSIFSMNKIFLFFLIASLTSLKGSSEGVSFPLMMLPRLFLVPTESSRVENQSSDRGDEPKQDQQQLNEQEHAREATDPNSTPPLSSRLSSSKTTRETTATSSPMPPPNASQNKLLASHESSGSSLGINQLAADLFLVLARLENQQAAYFLL